MVEWEGRGRERGEEGEGDEEGGGKECMFEAKQETVSHQESKQHPWLKLPVLKPPWVVVVLRGG